MDQMIWMWIRRSEVVRRSDGKKRPEDLMGNVQKIWRPEDLTGKTSRRSNIQNIWWETSRRSDRKNVQKIWHLEDLTRKNIQKILWKYPEDLTGKTSRRSDVKMVQKIWWKWSRTYVIHLLENGPDLLYFIIWEHVQSFWIRTCWVLYSFRSVCVQSLLWVVFMQIILSVVV